MTKKTFTDRIQQKAVNPTLQFISTPEAVSDPREEPQQKPESSPSRRSSGTTQAHRARPQFDEETKSRRLQLLLTPSLYDQLKRRADRERMSVNELINSILKDYLRK